MGTGGGWLETGVPGLDALLGGGLRPGSVALVLGPAGAGKTILAQQVAFHQARTGAGVLYLTGFSEPHQKLVDYAREVAFFDAGLLGTRIQLHSLPDLLRQGPEEAARAVVAAARELGAALVALDGYRGLQPLAAGAGASVELLYRLSSELAMLGACLLVLAEGEPEERERFPELTVADVVLGLRRERQGARHRRLVEVLKVRGAAGLGGLHPYRIDAAGLAVFPRLEAVASAAEPPVREDRAAFGLAALDVILAGGPVVGTTTLAAGSPGTGKTTLGLHFLAAGAGRGEPGLHLGFMESAPQLRATARAFGLDVAGRERSGRLRLLTLPPYEGEADEAVSLVREDIARRGTRRLVIDSAAELARAAGVPERERDFLGALARELRGRAVTAYLTLDIATVVGPELSLADAPISAVAENLLLLRQVELGGRLRRFLAALKVRLSDYDPAIHEYRIAAGRGLEVLGPAPAAEGLLTGLARSPAPPAGPGAGP